MVQMIERGEMSDSADGEFAVTSTSSAANAGPALTIYGANGEPAAVIDRDMLEFYLLLIQVVVLVALLIQGRKP